MHLMFFNCPEKEKILILILDNVTTRNRTKFRAKTMSNVLYHLFIGDKLDKNTTVSL